jgi:hypothetical protein
VAALIAESALHDIVESRSEGWRYVLQYPCDHTDVRADSGLVGRLLRPERHDRPACSGGPLGGLDGPGPKIRGAVPEPLVKAVEGGKTKPEAPDGSRLLGTRHLLAVEGLKHSTSREVVHRDVRVMM